MFFTTLCLSEANTDELTYSGVVLQCMNYLMNTSSKSIYVQQLSLVTGLRSSDVCYISYEERSHGLQQPLLSCTWNVLGFHQFVKKL